MFNLLSGTTLQYSTYNVGLLQAKAYRLLTHRTNMLLAPYGLTSVQWAMLGVLFDNAQPLALVQLAEKLEVDPPFITVLVAGVEKTDLIKIEAHPKDRRTKLVSLTHKGRKLVPEIEKILRREMKTSIHGVNLRHLLGYYKTLQAIVANNKS